MIPVGRAEYHILASPEIWLNCEIINAYLLMLQSDLNKHMLQINKQGTIVCMNTHFYVQCAKQNFDACTRQLKSRLKLALGGRTRVGARLWKMAIPMFVGGNHWVSSVVEFDADTKTCWLNFADSLYHGAMKMTMLPIQEWLGHLMADTHKVLPELDFFDCNYSFMEIDRCHEIPRQVLDYDNCGVFTLRVLECFLQYRMTILVQACWLTGRMLTCIEITTI